MIKKYSNWLLRNRLVVALLSVLIVGGLGSGAQFLKFDNDYRVFFGENNPELLAFDRVQNTYTKNDNVLIMLEPKNGDVFTPEVLAAVVDLTEQAWQTPYSNRVDSISNFQYSYAVGDEMIVGDLVTDPGSASTEQLQRWKQRALQEPQLLNKLISPTADATGINITVQMPGIDNLTETPEVVTFIREQLGEYRAKYPDISFHETGIVFMNHAFPEASEDDAGTLLPGAFLAILIFLYIFLRSIAAVLSSLMIIIFSIIAAMGTAGWLGIELTTASAVAPILILTLAVADCVHVLVSFRHNLRDGLPPVEATVESLRINFNPIMLTSVTTAIGFLSMNFSDSPPFWDLGNITAMGVMYAFLLSVTLLPVCTSFMNLKLSAEASTRTRYMEAFANWVIDKRKTLLITMSIIILALIAMVPKNELNDVFVEYFDTSIPFRVNTDHIAERLTGMYFVDFSLDSGEDEGLSDPGFLQTTEKFAQWLRARDEVVHVNSITDVFKRLNKNMHADDESYYRLPQDRQLAAQYLLLYEMSLPYGLDLNNQLNVNKSATRITATLKTLSSRELLAFEKASKSWLATNTTGIDVFPASPALMFAHLGQRNVNSMLIGTTIAIISISILLIFALRSLKFGLISLLPNLLPAGMGFGIWALVVGQVGLSVSVVAAMTLGIVVDDTIHFLSKYLRAKRELNLDAIEAVRYAFSTVGVALWVTTIVLVAGFMILAQSGFTLNSSMGLLTAITISMALVVDFLFLPPFLILLEEKKRETATVALQQA